MVSTSAGSLERFSAFRYRNFRLYWVGHFISLSGAWMQTAAQGWLVFSLTNSAFYLGVVTAAGSLPILFFTLFGGVLADRFRKRSLLLFTQTASILPAAALGFLTFTEQIQLWHIIALVGLLGVVNSLDIPVRQAFLIDLVEPESLHHAIALNAAAFNGARMIGPALAGFLISWLGIYICFWLNAVSFGASLLALYLIRSADIRKPSHKEGGIFARMKEGFEYLRGDKRMFSLMVLVSILSLLGLPYATLLPVFARKILLVDSEGYGLLMSSVGLGALSGALWLAFRLSRGGGSQLIIRMGGISFALTMIFFSQSKHIALSMLLLFCTGFAAVAVIASINTGIQRKAPDHLRGRVMSIYTTLFLGMFPLGSLIIGTSSHLIGAQLAVAINGTICLTVVGGAWLYQKHLAVKNTKTGLRQAEKNR